MLWLFQLTYCLTTQQRAQIKKASEIADLSIDFLEFEQVNESIASGAWIIFFGAIWCANTQRYL
jgi:hypothetical protein